MSAVLFIMHLAIANVHVLTAVLLWLIAFAHSRTPPPQAAEITVVFQRAMERSTSAPDPPQPPKPQARGSGQETRTPNDPSAVVHVPPSGKGGSETKNSNESHQHRSDAVNEQSKLLRTLLSMTGVPWEDNFDYEMLARMTDGLSACDLAELCMEAATIPGKATTEAGLLRPLKVWDFDLLMLLGSSEAVVKAEGYSRELEFEYQSADLPHVKEYSHATPSQACSPKANNKVGPSTDAKHVQTRRSDADKHWKLLQKLLSMTKARFEIGFDFKMLARMTDGFTVSDLAELCTETAQIPIKEMGKAEIDCNALRPLKLTDFVLVMLLGSSEAVARARCSVVGAACTNTRKQTSFFLGQ
ncbi:hypothetical protein HDU96_005294 [Phlyctochytrium bullatum]|nr:hypothetical protein HDU96_005294 [Phlyctochytrium bullatum]